MAQRRGKYGKFNDYPGLFDYQDNAPAFDRADVGSAPEDIIRRARAGQVSPSRGLKESDILEYNRRTNNHAPQLEYFSMGSGSSGNCSYLGKRGGKGIIIDAGIHPDIVMKALSDNYILPDNIVGIIITHDHSDHVRFAYSLLRKLRSAKIYCTPRTIDGILRRHSISRRIKEYHKPIFKEFEFMLAGMTITPFDVSHDGSDNVGFFIKAGEKHFVVATDMGYITERADYYIRQANFLMIESNYDSDMLDRGIYPEYLKARIRGIKGHLDNNVTASYLSQIWRPELTDIYLCHLSKDNNTPDIAISCTKEALEAKNISVGDASGSPDSVKADVQLYALPRYDVTPLFILRL